MSHASQGKPRWTGHGGDSDKTWSTGEGNGIGNHMNSMKRQKDMALEGDTSPPPGWKIANMLLGNSGEIATERRGWAKEETMLSCRWSGGESKV